MYLSLGSVSVSVSKNGIISKWLIKGGERILGHIVNLLTEAKPEILLSFVLNLSNNPLPFILLGGIFVANSNFSWLRILMTLLFGVFFSPMASMDEELRKLLPVDLYRFSVINIKPADPIPSN